MQVLRDEDRDIARHVGELDAPVHAELSRQRLEIRAETSLVEAAGLGRKLHAHEEEAEFHVLVLIGIEDVDVVILDEEIDDGDDDAFAVGAIDQEYGGPGHGHDHDTCFRIRSGLGPTPMFDDVPGRVDALHAAVPASDFADRIPAGFAARTHGLPGAVRAANTVLDVEGQTGVDRLLRCYRGALAIVGMDGVEPAEIFGAGWRGAGEDLPLRVDGEVAAFRIGDPGRLRVQSNAVAIVVRAFAQGLFVLFEGGYIDDGNAHAQHLAGFVTDRLIGGEARRRRTTRLGGRSGDFRAAARLALDRALEVSFDLGVVFGGSVRHFATQQGRHGCSVHGRETLVQGHVTKFAIEKAEADGGAIVDGPQLRQALGGMTFERQRYVCDEGWDRLGGGARPDLRKHSGQFGRRDRAAELPAVLAQIRPRTAAEPIPSLIADISLSLEGHPTERLSQLRAIYDSAPVGLCFLDCELRYVNLNQRLAAMNGTTVAALLGRKVADAVPEVYAQVEGHLKRALKGEAYSGAELSAPPKEPGGPPSTRLAFYQPVRDETGEVLGVCVSIVDISTFKQNEETLSESADHYRHSIGLNPQSPWVTDAEGRNLTVNSQWQVLTGSTPPRGKDFGWLDAVHPADLERTTETSQQSIDSGQPLDVEYRIRGKNGAWQSMRSRGEARRNSVGEITRWYGSVECIDSPRHVIKHRRRA